MSQYFTFSYKNACYKERYKIDDAKCKSIRFTAHTWFTLNPSNIKNLIYFKRLYISFH